MCFYSRVDTNAPFLIGEESLSTTVLNKIIIIMEFVP